ncbi:hypothetical protein SASPL_130656 [Salvia splendens]|uniref:Myb/SANT-like domain-containing protein n=1 Tax=Salvia splendens TaxID=180675 RepID=A0A8X8X7N0_SALSN|nr:hypothetical protein SASPL_130656 [Salvia splendens]
MYSNKASFSHRQTSLPFTQWSSKMSYGAILALYEFRTNCDDVIAMVTSVLDELIWTDDKRGSGSGFVEVGNPSQVNQRSPRRKFCKGDRSRRIWTVRDEEVLAACMLDLVARGWKSDNGFRTGYLGKIEDAIRKEFPTTDIKGTPYITSKIAAWNRCYTSLRGILGRSGVGFNSDGEYNIECDDDQWEAIADKDAKHMRHKSWPLWETWKLIFGKDRASGEGTEQINDAIDCMRAPATAAGGNLNMSSGNSDKQTSTTKPHCSKKRKVDGPDSALMEFLGNLHHETNNRLKVISSRIGYEFDLGQARQDVFDKLGNVDGLTLAQKYRLCNILSDKDKPQHMEVFMGMSAAARLGYLLMCIEESDKGA